MLIANEIQTVTYNYTIREQVADAVIDSVESSSPSDFALIIDDENTAKSRGKLKEYDDILDILENHVEVEQIGNLDFISIYVESPSAKEAAVIANSYAELESASRENARLES